MSDIVVDLGRLTIGFFGNNAISHDVKSELAAKLLLSGKSPDICFNFTEQPEQFKHQQFGNVRIGTDHFQVEHGRELVVDVMCNAQPISLNVACLQKTQTLPAQSFLRRLSDWNYLSSTEEIAKNFAYTVFDWSTQIAQIKLGQTYIHASALQKGTRTVAFLAWGGVGKTSALLKLCIEEGWRYLSDDLAAIDRDGVVYRSPKHLQIYAYNTEGEAALLSRLMKGRGFFDKAAWGLRRKLRGPQRVRRRVSAEDLFGATSVARWGKLTDVIFLERCSERGCAVMNIDPEELARRMAPIVIDEIEPYSAIYRRLVATSPNFIPSPCSVENCTRDILREAFLNIPAKLLAVGPGTTPTELASAVRKIV